MGMKRTTILGIGVNDADYVVKKTTYKGGRYLVIWECPYYSRWVGIIHRCYSEKVHRKSPAYAKCSICEEWKYFSNFKAWMELQGWEGKEIDKDILIQGNKIYSPSTCCFVDKNINVFVNDFRSGSECMRGVIFNRGKKKFEAKCNNPLTNRNVYIGAYDEEIDAHLAWKRRKHEYACILADSISDDRIAKALRIRYA